MTGSASLPPALVLAAGLGTRLQPLTLVRAKPAVPVGGRPIVVRIIEQLARAGVSDVVVNLHHRPETLTRAIGHGGASGVRVRYSWEPVVLGSAGGPRQALPLLGPRFFIVNGDTLTELAPDALAILARVHERSGAGVTLAVTPHPDPARYGGIVADRDGRVCAFRAAGGLSPLHFVGVQLAEASVFASLPAGEPATTIGGVYDQLLLNRDGRPTGKIGAHLVEGRFLDVGTPADYLAASLALAPEDRVMPGSGSVIDPSASVVRSVVWDRVTIGPGSRLQECIVADDVSLPSGAELRRRVVVSAAVAAAEADAVGRAPATTGGQPIGNAVAFPIDA